MTSFDTGEAITSVRMIPASVSAYYLTWGGRAVSMALIQTLLLLPRPIFAVLNAGIYVLAVNILYGYAVAYRGYGDRSFAPVTVSLLYLYMWFLMPDFAEVVTWTTGSITYLWMNTAILGFGLILYSDTTKNRDKERSGNTVAKSSCMILLGFCAGLSSEAGACALMVGLALYVIWSIRCHYKIRIDRMLGIISGMIGFAILMLSPGNRVRAAVSATVAENGSVLSVLAFRFARETFYTMMYLMIPIAISVTLYLLSRDHRLSLKSLPPELIYWTLAFVSIYVLTFSAGFADRVFQFPFMLISISIAMSTERILAGAGEVVIQRLFPALRIMFILFMMASVIEVVAGTMYSRQAESYYDRQIFHYHISDDSTAGLLPGDGLGGTER